MWAEFIDEANLEPTLWPRAIAPAEKLWSSSAMNDWRRAQDRFENHRCRMSRYDKKTYPLCSHDVCGNKRL